MIFQECAREYDPLLLEQLCDYMKTQESIKQILRLPSRNITKYLLNKSKLEDGLPTVPMHLDSTQQSFMEHLADHFRLIGDFEMSSHLYWRLGKQPSGAKISDRVHWYKQAITAVSCSEPEDLLIPVNNLWVF